PSPELLPNEKLVDPTDPATLAGATKLTGRLGEGLHVGSLAALTLDNKVTVQHADGTTREDRAIEPRTLSQALRLRQELAGNSTVGMFASAVTRAESERGRVVVAPDAASSDRALHALCPDGRQIVAGERCTRDAYVGAVDARWRSDNGDWAATSQIAAS